MNYDDIRKKIKSGDVLAFTHRSWSSWSDIESQIVRIMTQSEFSHVGLAWKTNGRVFILEAVVPEIRIFPLSNFEEFYFVDMPLKLSKESEEFALSMVGQKYSKMEAIKGYLGLNKLDGKWQCAEYVKSVLDCNKEVLNCKATPSEIVRASMEQLGCGLQLINNRRE